MLVVCKACRRKNHRDCNETASIDGTSYIFDCACHLNNHEVNNV